MKAKHQDLSYKREDRYRTWSTSFDSPFWRRSRWPPPPEFELWMAFRECIQIYLTFLTTPGALQKAGLLRCLKPLRTILKKKKKQEREGFHLVCNFIHTGSASTWEVADLVGTKLGLARFLKNHLFARNGPSLPPPLPPSSEIVMLKRIMRLQFVTKEIFALLTFNLRVTP